VRAAFEHPARNFEIGQPRIVPFFLAGVARMSRRPRDAPHRASCRFDPCGTTAWGKGHVSLLSPSNMGAKRRHPARILLAEQ
jgi:hypothetical protein